MSKARLVITAVITEGLSQGEAARRYGVSQGWISRATPATIYNARPKAAPGDRTSDTHDRVRADRIGATGTATLRHGGKLYHIGIGPTHAGTHILLLVQDLNIRIINAATGELLRELTLDPDRNYQPTGAPKGPARNRKPRT
jgi:hypothetical protein